jgi:hypothetical protein
MIKKISELNKEEQTLLLKAIANREVDVNSITEETCVGTESGDWFLSLMMMYSSAVHTGSDVDPRHNIICIGKAAKAGEEILKRRDERLREEARLKGEGI